MKLSGYRSGEKKGAAKEGEKNEESSRGTLISLLASSVQFSAVPVKAEESREIERIRGGGLFSWEGISWREVNRAGAKSISTRSLLSNDAPETERDVPRARGALRDRESFHACEQKQGGTTAV